MNWKNWVSTAVAFGILLIQLSAANLPEGFIEQRLTEGLNPTAMAMAPDGRIFITEKNGTVRVIKDGVLQEEPFIQIEVDDFNERGLAGITFHPNFDLNNYIYFFYTAPEITANVVGRAMANGDVALPNSLEVIFEMDELSGSIHNGGAMAFGPDGKLYVAAGEGGLPSNSSNLNNVLGSILRLNDDGSIPEDNPLIAETSGKNQAIYAYGFRNPFSFSFDPLSGRFFANDVGGADFEEINEVLTAKFYGWPDAEGPSNDPFLPSNYENPIHFYDHSNACAIVGSGFYNPELPVFPPEYQNKYFFMDFCNGTIQLFDPATDSYVGVFADGISQPVALLVSPDGALYYLERSGVGDGSVSDNIGSENGVLWRVEYTGSGVPFVSGDPSDLLIPVGETAQFNVSASGGQPLAYQWEVMDKP